ncbi:MAG: ABC transporter substrate-binding protein [Anaerolineales bacterium]|nr:ABC transporter substrate-binding protein [Anaerolineales bacterium]
MKKTNFFILLMVGLLMVTGCSPVSGGNQADSSVQITDSTGQTLVLDEVPQRIAVAGKATVMVQDAVFLFEEAEDRVIALENRNQSAFGFLPVVDPTFEQKEFIEMNAGPEQIAAVNPDLVIMKNFLKDSLGASLESLDIPVFYLDLETPEAFYQDVTALGELFANPARAEEINRFYQERVELVESLTADLSPEQKPSVLVLEYSDRGGETAFSVPPVSWLQTRMVEIAGGTPIWKGMDAGGGWSVVTLDQIAAWNPDQIYIIDYQGKAAEVTERLRENDIWSSLKAVENDQLYAFAFDYYSWDQPDTRWILGLEWMASKIHPENAPEIDILEQVEEFYVTLYRLDQETIAEDVISKLTGDLP